MGGQRVVYRAELDTCSCGPWTNLIMCSWPGSAAWLHTPVLGRSVSDAGFLATRCTKTVKPGTQPVAVCSLR